jgi:TetR/AcrR family tetracycline transcriptional repressor
MSSVMAIQKEMIIQVALQLLQEQGLEGVTLRKVMKVLNVQAPAIYWRFKEKRELLEAMAETILQEEFHDLMPYQSGSTSWQSWIVTLFHRLRTIMLAYKDGARIITGARPLRAPTLGMLSEYALRALETEGFALPDAATLVFTMMHYTFGHVIEEQSAPDARDREEAASQNFREAYPTISRLLTLSSPSPEAIYDAGLQMIIRGFSSTENENVNR